MPQNRNAPRRPVPSVTVTEPNPAMEPTDTEVVLCDVTATEPVIRFKPEGEMVWGASTEPFISCLPAIVNVLDGVDGPNSKPPELEAASAWVPEVASVNVKGMAYQME